MLDRALGLGTVEVSWGRLGATVSEPLSGVADSKALGRYVELEEMSTDVEHI
jgi:hypothetical protein